MKWLIFKERIKIKVRLNSLLTNFLEGQYRQWRKNDRATKFGGQPSYGNDGGYKNNYNNGGGFK